VIAIFCGSRDWKDREAIRKVMSGLDQDGLTVIHGAQRGADVLSGEVALELGVSVIPVPADWDAYGDAAGPIRNEQMKEILVRAGKQYAQPVGCYGFHEDPRLGRGTGDMVRRARRAGIRSYVYLSITPEMVRVSGDVVCGKCDSPYWKHPKLISELDQDGNSYLELACDGRALKL
jgi:hypothetical protein